MRVSQFILMGILFFVQACNQSKPAGPPVSIDLVSEKMKLLQADEDFSNLSVEKGMKAAFMEYMDSNAVLLRGGQLPMIGANAIDFLISQNDTGYTLNWRPESAFLSAAADMGYIYGIYALHPSTMDTVLYGTYVSIWKKQADGKWKFVLDSGNEGIESTNFEY